MTSTFQPEYLNIQPLTSNAITLKEIIRKELIANGFDPDFIVEAHIEFEFPAPQLYRTTIYCYPYMVDKDGRRYEAKRVIAEGLEPDFDPFDEQRINPSQDLASRFIQKMKRLFK